MKRSCLLLFCCLLSAWTGYAREIPRERAALLAAEVFRSARPASVSGPVGEPRLVKESECTYIFENEGGGYAIVSADDVAAPVLGYSLEGRFPVDDVPVNLQSVLDWYDRVIAFARERGWESASSERTVGTSDREVRLQTARWGQGSPFNDLSPVIDGKKCPSGCVATAEAIILKYHSYPEHGTGVLPGYDFGWDNAAGQYKYHIDGYALGHTYDWNNMPDNARNCTEYQAAQIAQLLYDLAVMSGMEFTPEGSGAASTSPLLLVNYFGYDPSIRFYDRSFFSTQQWEQMIRDEIDAGRPVFHCGFSEDGGHAFVMDGYKGRYFSINYGWSGGSAWYLLSPIEGHDDELTEFTEWQDMVCHIQPDAGGQPFINLVVPDEFLPFRWNFEEQSVWGGWFWLWDYSVKPGVVELAYGLFDRDGRFKERVSEAVLLNLEVDYMPEVTITFPDRIEDGDCILLAQHEADAWTPLLQTRRSYIRFDRSRKLPQMVAIGHSFGTPDHASTTGKPMIFFEMYKDVWWSLSSEEDGRVLFDSALEIDPSSPFSVSAYLVDEETGLARFECTLPEGNYRMTLRNFDETLTFTFQI